MEQGASATMWTHNCMPFSSVHAWWAKVDQKLCGMNFRCDIDHVHMKNYGHSVVLAEACHSAGQK